VTTSHVLSHAPNKQVWRTSKNYALNSEYTLNNEVRLTTGVYGMSGAYERGSREGGCNFGSIQILIVT